MQEIGTLILPPPFTPPLGQRIAAATRMPPSHASNLFPRNGRLFFGKPPTPPLSLKNKTIVFAASPESSIALRICPMPSSMHATIAATVWRSVLFLPFAFGLTRCLNFFKYFFGA